jgi:hypothetical protein
MGSWGYDPLQNDTALDWLEQLFRETELEARLEAALAGSVADDADEIRCAAAVIEMLVRNRLWGGTASGRIVTLALDRLQLVVDVRREESVQFHDAVRRQMASLTALLPPSPPLRRRPAGPENGLR